MVFSVIAVTAVAVVAVFVAVFVDGRGRLEGVRPATVGAMNHSVLVVLSRFQVEAALEATESRHEAVDGDPSLTECIHLNGVWAVISSAIRQTEAILTEISPLGSPLGTPARRLQVQTVQAVLAGDCLLEKRAV